MLFNFQEIKEILDKKERNVFIFIYFNRQKIHQILKDEYEIINVDFIEIENNLAPLFYLSLFIKEYPNVINVVYSINFIKKINDLQEKNHHKIYKKLMISKIILELFENYKQTDYYDEEGENEELNEIEKYNENIIKDNINALNKIGLKIDKENFINKKVDEIFSEIIKSLIISKKFDDFNYIYNIIDE